MAELTFEEIQAGASRLGYSLKSLSASTDSTSQSLRGLSHVTGTLTSSFSGLASGTMTMTGLVASIKSLASAIPAVGGTITALIDPIEMIVQQMEATLTPYQELSKSGYSASEGMDDLALNLAKAGMPLKMYTGILERNSKAFINLSGSADEAAKEFSEVFSKMRAGADQQLRNMGFTSEEIGDTLALFVDRQRRLGTMQGQTQNSVIAGAMKLGKELEEVAKLTGASRQEQREALKQAMLNARYNASQRKLRRSGKEGEIAADNIQEMVLATQNLPGLSKAIQDASTGFINSPEARQWAVSIPGFMRIMNQVRAGSMDWGTAMGEIQQGSKQFIGTVEDVAVGIGDTGILASMNEMGQLVTMANGNITRAVNVNGLTVDDMANMHKKTSKDGKGLDSITVELTKAALNLEKVSGLLTGSVMTLETFSGAIEAITGELVIASQELNNFSQPRSSSVEEIKQAEINVTNANVNLTQASGGWMKGLVSDEKYIELGNKLTKAEKDLKLLVERKPLTIADVIEGFRSKEQTISGINQFDETELLAYFEKMTGVDADVEITKAQATKLGNLLQKDNDTWLTRGTPDWLQQMFGGEGGKGQGWNPKNNQILKDFVKTIEGGGEKPFGQGKNVGDQSSINQDADVDVPSYDNIQVIDDLSQQVTISLNKMADSYLTLASALKESTVENSKKSNSILSALNQGNKNTKDIKQYVQVV
jgi:hypothetical protein